jgi:hypothetical protein
MGTMKDMTNPRMNQIGIRTRVTSLPNTPSIFRGYKCNRVERMTFALPKNCQPASLAATISLFPKAKPYNPTACTTFER